MPISILIEYVLLVNLLSLVSQCICMVKICMVVYMVQILYLTVEHTNPMSLQILRLLQHYSPELFILSLLLSLLAQMVSIVFDDYCQVNMRLLFVLLLVIQNILLLQGLCIPQMVVLLLILVKQEEVDH